MALRPGAGEGAHDGRRRRGPRGALDARPRATRPLAGALCPLQPIKVVVRDARDAGVLVGFGWGPQPRPPYAPDDAKRLARGWDARGCRLWLRVGARVVASAPLESRTKLQGGATVIARWNATGPRPFRDVDVVARDATTRLPVVADAGPRVAVAAMLTIRKGYHGYTGKDTFDFAAGRPTTWSAAETRCRLAHWLDHHRRLGVARFYVVDNDPGGPDLALPRAPDVVHVAVGIPFDVLYDEVPGRVEARGRRKVHGQVVIENAMLAAVRADWLLVSDQDEYPVVDDGRGTLAALVARQPPDVGSLALREWRAWTTAATRPARRGTPCLGTPEHARVAARQWSKAKNVVRTAAVDALSVHYVTLRPPWREVRLDPADGFAAHYRGPHVGVGLKAAEAAAYEPRRAAVARQLFAGCAALSEFDE